MAIIFNEGTLLQIEDSVTAGTFITIAQMVTIQPGAFERESVPTDDLSTVGAKPTRPSLMYTPPEIQGTGNYDPTDTEHTRLETEFIAGTQTKYRIVWNNGTSSRPHREFTAHLSRFGFAQIENDSNAQIEFTLKQQDASVSGTTVIA